MDSLIPDIPLSKTPQTKNLVYNQARRAHQERIQKGYVSRTTPSRRLNLIQPLSPRSKPHQSDIGDQALDHQLKMGNIPKHLQVQRNLPKLSGSLACSEELRDIWDSHLQRAGKRLGQAWRQERSRKAKRLKESQLRPREYNEGTEAKNLLQLLLKRSSKRCEDRVSHRQKKAEKRHHPYKR
ncbi:hypothetical protein HOLleu_14423 [Holothuria leucospilota]|uniref:Uncharacterized protein n=1 Tax=Holothuria leucospilota TaxID=206669 RepID=A0A9Q1C876_HOLLE|nr:hypothetical protein HOLleu_14423 [Holothuria leucospilota]